MTMKFEVPQKIHVLRLALSIDMVPTGFAVGEVKRCYGRKRQGPTTK